LKESLWYNLQVHQKCSFNLPSSLLQGFCKQKQAGCSCTLCDLQGSAAAQHQLQL
jgi:hypothetical protein